MFKGLYLTHGLHVELVEVGTDESGGVEVICEDGGIREVDRK